jgi:hypothetical protein
MCLEASVTLLAPFEFSKKHWKNIEKFGSCPLRSKTLVFPGFFAFRPIALAFLPIHACPCLQVLRRLVRCLGPW